MKLTDEELDHLWKLYKTTGKEDYRDKLILHYLRLVKIVVGRIASHLPSHIKIDDLYSSGVTGLLRAVERFDPEKKNKFETYAPFVIKGAVLDELRRIDWVPRSIHQKANQIAAAHHTLCQKLGREPSDEELAFYLGITERELGHLLEIVRPAILIPLNTHVSDEEGGLISEQIPDLKAETSFDVAHRKEYCDLLAKAIADLPEQERKVLVLYYFEELMLKEIGEVLGVSESRVSQIHTKALLTLRNRLRRMADEFAKGMAS